MLLLLVFLIIGFVLGIGLSLWVFQNVLSPPIAHPSSPPPPLLAGSQFEGRHLFSDNEANLSAKAVNAVLQFLFQELKDSGKVRRYFIRKLDADLRDVMEQKILSAIVKRIEIKDFSLGQQSPEFTEISLNAAEMDSTMSLSYVEVGVHMKYLCGIWLSTELDLVLDQSAQISVKLLKFEADAKLVFKREPFTHWYLSFCSEPNIDLEVSTQIQSRNLSQLASLIGNQLKKTIGRRHVWPSYSIRFRPFFDSSPIVKKSREREERPFDLLVVHVRSLDRLFEKKAQKYCMVGVLVADKSIMTMIEESQSRDGDREVAVPKTSQVKFSDMILVGISITYVSHVPPGGPLREGVIVVAINETLVLGADHAKHLFERSPHNVIMTVRDAHIPSDEDFCDHMTRISYLFPDTVLRTTKPISFRRFMEFDESFIVRPDEFVNICLLGKDESSKLMAFTSFTLDEIVRDCDLTLRRECQFSRNLIRVAQKKDEDHELAKHRGYDRMLANGHITVRFQLIEGGELPKEDPPQKTNGHLLETRRLTVNAYCAFCSGKIWLKNAFECVRCNILCHRKCVHLCYISPCVPEGYSLSRVSSREEMVDTRGRARITRELDAIDDDKFEAMVKYTSDHMLITKLRMGALSLKNPKYVPTAKLPVVGVLNKQLKAISRSIENERGTDDPISLRTQLIQFRAIEETLAGILEMNETRLFLSSVLQLVGGTKAVVVQPPPSSFSSALRRCKDKVIGSWGIRKPIRQSMADVVSAVYNRTQRSITTDETLYDSISFRSHHI